MRQSWETMTSVSAGHIILTPTQPVGSGRPQRESDQELRALPTELPRPPIPLCVLCLEELLDLTVYIDMPEIKIVRIRILEFLCFLFLFLAWYAQQRRTSTFRLECNPDFSHLAMRKFREFLPLRRN